MLTAEQVERIGVGTRLRLNSSVHVEHGPDPEHWSRPYTVVEVSYRGRTADCHPRGGGLPYVGVECPLGDGGRLCFSVGVGDRHVEVLS